MSSYNELIALINGCINRNGVQAITGRVLNGVLRAMVNQLGAGYAMGGVAHPTDDPGTPEAPVCYYASEVGTYTHFGNIQIVPGELALLCFDLTDGWFKETMYEGFESVQATIDGNVGPPAVNVTYVNGVLSFDFSNMKGNTGAAAGFGNVTAAVDGTSGTPGVSVQTDGPDTAKNIAFLFSGLKGETGVTSVIATVDNTSGTPQCAVSLNGQQLTLAFTGLKGAQGDTGSSVAYPFTIVNNLTTNDATQALSAAMGVQLESEVSQLEAKIDGSEQNAVSGKYINSSGVETNDPNATVLGFIPYSSGDVDWLYGTRNANYKLCFFDSSKQLVGYFSEVSDNSVTSKTITAAEISTNAPGAAFLKASLKTADGIGVTVGGVLIRPVYTTVIGLEDRIEDLEDDVTDLQEKDTELEGGVTQNATDIVKLKAEDAIIEGKIEEFVGPFIASNNGNGGITSESNIQQGGVVTTGLWDLSKKWFAEVVVKPVTGSAINMFADKSKYGGSNGDNVLRINNGNLQFYVRQSSSTYLFSQSFTSTYHLTLGNWYHLIFVYDGTNVYFYANGNLIDTKEITLVLADTVVGPWEMDARHSPKLLRVGYLPNDFVSTDVADLVAAHYNGNNPFGYDASGDDLLVEYLPANMLKTSIKNTANDMSVTYSPEKTFDILTENPWAAVIEGHGAPSINPVYVGQKYKDLDTGKEYTAVGNSSLSDWQYYAKNTDLEALKSQTKTVNGQSIWGSGDIEAGSGSGGSTFVSVKDKGAVGDGLTDDTDAIMTATEYARANGKALYFPIGVYLTRKSIILTSGMRITGEPGATLQNAAATLVGSGKCPYTQTTANAAQGAHSVSVSDASKFTVGDEIVIWKTGSYTETMADITDITGNTITFSTERFTADGTDGGLLNAVASGGYVLTDFAMIKTIMTKAAVNVVVENITIKPLSDILEPHIYTSSPISQTKEQGGVSQSGFRVHDVTVMDSANDGISLQGSGDSEVVGCRVYNQKHKGIHWGTSHDKIRIEGCYVYGCGSYQYEDYSDYQGSGAMFFCSNNHRTIIVNNIIENCYKGVYGFNYQGNGEQDTDTVISGNLFKNCGKYGVMLRGGYRAVVTDNIFTDFDSTAIPVHTEAESTFKFTAGVISNNVFGNFGSSFAGPAIEVTGARNLILAGNNVSGYVDNDASTVRDHCDITVATSEKVAITNNVVDGVIDISDAGNTGIVKDNNIETS